MATQQSFIKAIARAVDVSGVHSSRLGLISYGDGAYLNVRFKDRFSHAEFESIVDKLPFESGVSRFGGALQLAASSMFAEAAEMRFGIPKLFLMVVDDGNLHKVTDDLTFNI